MYGLCVTVERMENDISKAPWHESVANFILHSTCMIKNPGIKFSLELTFFTKAQVLFDHNLKGYALHIQAVRHSLTNLLIKSRKHYLKNELEWKPIIEKGHLPQIGCSIINRSWCQSRIIQAHCLILS